jgi:hypothetical protein
MELLEYLIQVRGGRQGKEEADQTARGFEHLRRSADEAKLSSATLGVGLNSVSGRLQLAALAATFLGPALIGIGMSAGAALVGGGVVAGGGLMALIVGLSGFLLIGKSVVAGTKNVTTALDAYHVSVAATGRYSDQSMKALQHLDAVVATSGGPKVLAAVRAWNSLKNTFHDLTGSARSELLGTYTDAVRSASKVMPLFAAETNRSAPVIRGAIQEWLALFTGSEARSGFRDFGRAFREMLPSLSGGGQGVFLTLARVLRAALPYVVQGADAFDRFGGRLALWSSNGRNVSHFVATVVGHLRSWLGLLGALGHLTGTVFGMSAGDGRKFVDTLTIGVRRFDAWIASGNRGRSTFRESAALLRQLGTSALPIVKAFGVLAAAIAPVARGLAGSHVLIVLFTARLYVLAAILKALGPAAVPIITAMIVWRSTVMALNVVLGLMGVELSALGIAATGGIILIAAGFYLAYTRVGWFHNAVNSVFSWLRSNWPLVLAILTGPFGLATLYIVRHWDGIVSFVKALPGRLAGAGKGMWSWIANGFRDTLNWVITRWNNFHIGMGGVKIAGHTVVPGFDLKTPDIPMLAEGGIARMAGSAIVGEEGPEMVDLPAGAVVSPLGRGGDIVLKVDGRTWARVTRKQILEAQAGA